MNTVTVITFAVLLSIIDIVHIGCRPTYIQNNSTNKIQACGTDLADILQATCLFGYNSYYQGDEYGKYILFINTGERTVINILILCTIYAYT